MDLHEKRGDGTSTDPEHLSFTQKVDTDARQKRPRYDSEESRDVSTWSESELSERGKWKRQRRTTGMISGVKTYLVVHEVYCDHDTQEHDNHPFTALFFDVPRLNAADCSISPLHGEYRLEETLDEYLKEHPEVSFTVVRRYSCIEYHRLLSDSFEKLPLPYLGPSEAEECLPYYTILKHAGPPAVPLAESIQVLSPPLIDAMRILEASNPILRGWDLVYNLQAPYIHFYHTKEDIKESARNILDDEAKMCTTSLLDYVEKWLGPEYDEADALFKRGVVTLKHLPKLFRRQDIIVTLEDGHTRGYCATSCESQKGGVQIQRSTWSFDGFFRQTKSQIFVRWQGNEDEELAIERLDAYPLRYATSGLREKQLARGALFWSCRNRNFISYTPPRRTFEFQTSNPRYMIDMQTYEHLHERESNTSSQDVELDENLMDSDTPPSEEFALQLPPKILGFGLHDKKWRNLFVEHIQQINWNKTAFDRLVLDADKKSLVTAMVKEHVLADTSSDIIEGKGNGLIILLHGSPGTGKTLTAESVAELAEKPLYRVTCGDIGTDPEAVEKYLESVLYIGTLWKAVVLFDESDVFLEERTQFDLQRNALVSVFLRVLEYYDGILILTSNRVGTFDEAFKSRVHLALHYPVIDERGRVEIWHDFIQQLEKLGVDANYDQLKSKTSILALDNLNGRQIRNSIRTARQLASQSKEPLSYDHLRKAMKVAQEFEKYVVETHGGNTYEEVAKTNNIRAR